jgi:hypothetical protein
MKFKSNTIVHQPKSKYLGKATANNDKKEIQYQPVYHLGSAYSINNTGNLIITIE